MKEEILSCRFRSLNFKNQIVDEVENLDLLELTHKHVNRLEQSRYGVKEFDQTLVKLYYVIYEEKGLE
jgi:hypothetical protein